MKPTATCQVKYTGSLMRSALAYHILYFIHQ